MDVSEQREKLISSISMTIAGALESLTFDNHVAAFDYTKDVVLNVLARIGSQLNVKNPDFLSRFPVEIQTRCFESLELEDCMVIIRVCSSWRSVAIAHPCLWNEIDLDSLYVSEGSKDQVVSLCLARSAALPVHLTGSLPSYLDELISKNMHRWATLDGYPDHSFSLPAPQLLRVFCSGISLPEGWDGRPMFPRLQLLNTNRLELPRDFQPFTTLRHLSCCGGTIDLNRLFDLFPRLDELYLWHMSSILISPHLPSSLKNVVMLAKNGDMSSALEIWRRKHSLQTLRIGFVKLGPLMHFLADFLKGASFSMTWESFEQIILKTQMHSEQDCIRVITATISPISLEQLTLTERIGIFDQLTYLETPYPHPFNLLSACRYLALEDLIIHAANLYDWNVSDEDEGYRTNGGPKAENTPINAPCLRRLVIRSEWYLYHFDVSALWKIIDFDHWVNAKSRKLESVTIITKNGFSFDQCNWNSVFLVADKIRYKHPDPEYAAENCELTRPDDWNWSNCQ